MTREHRTTEGTDAESFAEPDQPSEGENQPAAGIVPGSGSRRRFLQASAGALAATTLASSSVAAQQGATRLCDSFETLDVGGGDFTLINNDWGGDVDMCIWAADDGTYGYEWETRTTGGEPNYPQVLCGTKPWGDDSGVAEFPIPRGDVQELEMAFDVDVNISGGEWNLAEEWWLMDGQPDADDAPHTHEIMLVCDWGGGHDHGSPVEPGAFQDAHGNVIDHWISYDSGGTDADFHIFRLAEPTTTGVVDLTAIMDYVENEIGGVSDDLLLSGIELGNEYWQGARGDVTYNTFDVTINGQTYTSGDGTSVDVGGGSDDNWDDGDDGSDDGGSDEDNWDDGDEDGSDDGGSDDNWDDCPGGEYASWDPNEVYTEGDRVTHDGSVWEAQWWTRGDEPRDEAWYVWERVEDSGASAECDAETSISSWDSNSTYTGGDRVSYDGSVWEAQWWTRGDEPRDDLWSVWQQIN